MGEKSLCERYVLGLTAFCSQQKCKTEKHTLSLIFFLIKYFSFTTEITCGLLVFNTKKKKRLKSDMEQEPLVELNSFHLSTKTKDD